MFRKKKLEVRMVEDNGAGTDTTMHNYNYNSQIPGYIHDTVVEVASLAVLGIGVYFLGDTVRKCVVHVVATKVS